MCCVFVSKSCLISRRTFWEFKINQGQSQRRKDKHFTEIAFDLAAVIRQNRIGGLQRVSGEEGGFGWETYIGRDFFLGRNSLPSNHSTQSRQSHQNAARLSCAAIWLVCPTCLGWIPIIIAWFCGVIFRRESSWRPRSRALFRITCKLISENDFCVVR